MKIYLSGKITGDPGYREKFSDAERALIKAGYAVMNPAILPDGWEHDAYMRICFAMLDECDAICMLPDWDESEGAKAELDRATATGKPVILYEGLIKRRAESRVVRLIRYSETADVLRLERCDE